MPKYFKVCQSVLNCVQLYRKSNDIYFQQLKMIYAKLCKSVPVGSKLCRSVINLCKMSEIYLLWHSLAQFYTFKHTYARLSTKIIFTRVCNQTEIPWDLICFLMCCILGVNVLIPSVKLTFFIIHMNKHLF